MELDSSDITSVGPRWVLLLAAFVLMAGLSAVDLASDLGEGTSLSHVAFEAAILLTGFVGATLVLRELVRMTSLARAASAEALSLAQKLESSKAEAETWRAEARDLVRGLGQAIDEQFERWQLSPAEKEVGLLLLKGLSHREIALARSVTEATARQQARSMYRKAGLSGRNDLAAFFLEDLMLPSEKPR